MLVLALNLTAPLPPIGPTPLSYACRITALRTEFAKAWARRNRWQEESRILPEEMRRTIQFLMWEESVWLGRVVNTTNTALRAYAMRQARLRRHLYKHFASLWSVFDNEEAIWQEIRALNAKKSKGSNDRERDGPLM